MSHFTSHSEEETRAIAARLAQNCKGNEVFLLQGTLGAGKSVFARAFVRSLMQADIDVPSPTFTLVQSYETPKGPLWHFDLYRLQEPDEIFEIGWEDALTSGIVLIEWPERLGPYTPPKAQYITLRIGNDGPNHREIEVHDPQTR